jgi:hypothetical protein
MKTYQFTAFQNQRYAAYGNVQADSPEEAKARILERYHEGLAFHEYVEEEAPDHFTLTDEEGEDYDFEDETPQDVLKAMAALIDKADDLIAAIDGTTGQFEAEVSALSEATSAAEKAIQAAGGAS